MADKKIRFAAMGDILLNRKDPESMFAQYKSYFDGFDIVFANLEAQLPSKEFPKRGMAGKAQRGDAWMVKGLEGVLDVISVANNHIMDYGWAGLEDTIKTLNEHGIAAVGAGANRDKAAEPVILERNGMKVGVLAFNAMGMFVGPASDHYGGIAHIRVNPLYDYPHMDLWDVKFFTDHVKALAAKVDFVVASLHWGMTGYTVQSCQKALAKEAIDAGASLVLGTHPHSIQGIEVYKGKVILYGLCNFGMDHTNSQELHEVGNETMVFECSIVDGAIQEPAVKVGVLHVVDGKDVPELFMVESAEGKAVADRIEQISQPFGTVFKRAKDKLYISLDKSRV
jgi:poly-gamma-glutamate capsule biosynthesis protein CapA/YwtB (metallophosphatase superfamily)